MISPTPKEAIEIIDLVSYEFSSSFGIVSTIIGTNNPVYTARLTPVQAISGKTHLILLDVIILNIALISFFATEKQDALGSLCWSKIGTASPSLSIVL